MAIDDGQKRGAFRGSMQHDPTQYHHIAPRSPLRDGALTGLGKSKLDAVGNVHTMAGFDRLRVTWAAEHLAENGRRGWLGQQVPLAADFRFAVGRPPGRDTSHNGVLSSFQPDLGMGRILVPMPGIGGLSGLAQLS